MDAICGYLQCDHEPERRMALSACCQVSTLRSRFWQATLLTSHPSFWQPTQPANSTFLSIISVLPVAWKSVINKLSTECLLKYHRLISASHNSVCRRISSLDIKLHLISNVLQWCLLCCDAFILTAVQPRRAKWQVAINEINRAPATISDAFFVSC